MNAKFNKPNVIVIGAGIVGLAMARSLSMHGYQVSVFERNEKAIGASIRNFGMVWPIGQPNGVMYERALQSRNVWREIAQSIGLWHHQAGSLHLAYHSLEADVLQEVAAMNNGVRPLYWLDAKAVQKMAPGANPAKLLGGLYSSDEVIIESRLAIEALPGWLTKNYGVEFFFNTAITEIKDHAVRSGKRWYHADKIVVCSGADFETLYPEVYSTLPITKCKLQMMRIAAQPKAWRIGPALCGGLSLTHYKGFSTAPSIPLLKAHFEATMPEYLKWGIHVMVSQNGESELTIGDSHEYGNHLDPFDRAFINQLIIDYLKTFAQFKSWEIIQSWNGVYSKMVDGSTEVVLAADENVLIVNGLGGAGMTLSFGLAEEVVRKHF